MSGEGGREWERGGTGDRVKGREGERETMRQGEGEYW